MSRDAPELVQLVSELRIAANIPLPATNFRSMDDGVANIYVFETKPGVHMVYRYDVELSTIGEPENQNRSLTRGVGDEGKRGLLQEICFQLVTDTFKHMNGGNVPFVYDNRKILFTNIQVDPMHVEIVPEQMSDFCRLYLRNKSVLLEMQPCRQENAHQLNLNDIRRALQPSPSVQADHSMRMFLQMLTSQPFINAGTHQIVGAGRLFEKAEAQPQRINPAITTHNGVAKGVRIIINGDVKPCAALVADVKTCAFFVADNLQEIANEMIQHTAQHRHLDRNNRRQMDHFWTDFGHLYNGISAHLTYAPSRVIVIGSITTRNCGEIMLDVDGVPMSMPEYYERKKEIKINPNMPAVCQDTDRDTLFPLECLQILPMQRLGLDKMSINEELSNVSRELLAANSVTPQERYDAILNEMRKIGTGDCAKFMMQFNIRLKGDKNDVQIGRLQLPTIMYGNERQQEQDDRGRFDAAGPMRYLEPSSTLRSWMIAHPRNVEEGQYSRFVRSLTDMARQRGVQLPPPSYDLMEGNQMVEKMKRYAAQKIDFILYIDYKYMKFHAQLKLLEKRFGVLTQHVTIEMIQKAGPPSVSNVLNKMNMKLSGLNYIPLANPACKEKLDLSSGRVLVIGLDTSKPPPATGFEIFKMQQKKEMKGLKSEDPMVVGICANYLTNPLKFAGDYYFQPCRQDMLNPDYLIRKMQWLLAEVKANRPKPAPKVVFIIRDGVSEGMIPKLLAPDGEYQAFVEACHSFSPQWKPKFVYCIVDKRHNKRFFVNANGNNGNGNGNNGNGVIAANTMPGSVVDRKFVRVDMHEFFLQPHFPLKGVSKIPQYAFPVNEIDADNNELEAFIHYLCNMWQIVGLAPSLPTPVLQAKELAKRGRNNYVDLKRTTPRLIPRLPSTGQEQVQPGQYQYQHVDIPQLNTMLSYTGGTTVELTRTRFNA